VVVFCHQYAEQIKTVFRKKLGQIKFKECLLSVCSESFLPISSVKTKEIKIYKTVALPFVLYGYESWSFTLRKNID
jgi:hypothetical protein